MLDLRIISPECLIYSGSVDYVTLPGTVGSFTVLENHAPIISSLEKGTLVYNCQKDGIQRIGIKSGFAELKDNVLSVCVEL